MLQWTTRIFGMPQMNESNSPHSSGTDAAFHVALLLLISGLWCVTIVLAFVPNNRLHEMGLGNAIAIDLTVGVLFALAIAILSIRRRKSCPSTAIFALVQLLAWGHSIGIWLFLFIAAYFAIQRGL